MAKILLVEDDYPLSQFVVAWLVAERHVVDVIDNGADGLHAMLLGNCDIVLLDWNLPEMSGQEIVSRFRARGHLTPVIMLTAKSEIDDKELGLDSGADDYLTKPFSLSELSARIRMLLRRQSTSQGVLVCGDITLDSETMKVTRAGEEILLLPKEFSMLELLMQNANHVLSQEAIIDEVWQPEGTATKDAFNSCLKRLRQKLGCPGEDKPLIETVYGAGYRLNSTG
jgi:two-component system OmpR family response regulator